MKVLYNCKWGSLKWSHNVFSEAGWIYPAQSSDSTAGYDGLKLKKKYVKKFSSNIFLDEKLDKTKRSEPDKTDPKYTEVHGQGSIACLVYESIWCNFLIPTVPLEEKTVPKMAVDWDEELIVIPPLNNCFSICLMSSVLSYRGEPSGGPLSERKSWLWCSWTCSLQLHRGLGLRLLLSARIWGWWPGVSRYVHRV